MAKNTNINLRNKTIYQVFLRQHSKEMNFKGLISDLERIKNLGVDIIYLLPFHPIGIKNRKGEVGSPYSIYDYYEIDPLHGNLDDFINLVNKVHQMDMKIMMDIVINHTSRDSILTKEHPDWFYRTKDGEFINRIGDWSDITDLHLENNDVRKYLIDMLKYWAKYVDGFRCDVAPLLPLSFWEEARLEVDKINSNLIWLSESVEYGFIKYLRDEGYDCLSDSEIYQVFDIAYDYDIFSYMDSYLRGDITLSKYLEEIKRQEVIYPKNYVKLRSFENHDQERIASKTKNQEQLLNLTAFQFFLKGTPMLYAGQEHQVKKRPDLFEYDLIKWDNKNSIEDFLKTLIHLKKDEIFSKGILNFLETNHIAILSYTLGDKTIYGIFNLENLKETTLNIKDGTYINLLNNESFSITNNKVKLKNYPIIFYG